MKYPKEAVEACLPDSPADCYNGQDVIDVALWAQWAHDQLRPRKVSEEEPPIGRRIEVYSNLSNAWIHGHVMSRDELSSSVFTYWRYIGPPPPGDDGFEEWYANHDPMPADNFYKGVAQAAWKAALARKEEG